MRYSPSLVVATTKEAAVAVLTAVMVTPGNTPLCASLTRPSTVPVTTWAPADPGPLRHASTATPTTASLRMQKKSARDISHSNSKKTDEGRPQPHNCQRWSSGKAERTRTEPG